MSKKLRNIVIIIGLTALSFWLGIRFERLTADFEEIGKPVYIKEQIYFPEKNETVYLKSKIWGLTGDHQITTISTNPDSEFFPDSTSEYIFYGFEALIYKKSKDTLYIFAGQTPEKPVNFNSKINIVMIKTQAIEWTSLNEKIKNNYRKFE